MSGALRRTRPVWLLLAAGLLLGLGAAGLGVLLWGEYHWHAAQEALHHHHLALAEQHLGPCLRLWPGSAEVNLLAARVVRRRDQYDLARRHLQTCERLQGVTPASARERALLAVQQGQLNLVEKDLRALVEHQDADSDLILEALAKGYMNSYRMDEALDSLDLLLEHEPDHVPGLLLRGRVLESQQHDDEARQDYERAVQLEPEEATARLRLADCCARLGLTPEAVAHYEYLRGRPPVQPAVLLGLARCRLDLHELDEADSLLRPLLTEQPENSAVVAEWGRVAVRAGRADEAEPRLRAAAVRAPYDRDVRLVLYLCLTTQGKTEEAERCRFQLRAIEDDLMRLTELQNRLAAEDGDETELRRQIGSLLLHTGRHEEGVRWLLSVLDRNPGDAPAHRALADYYEQTGRPEEAARHRRTARAGQ